MNLLFLKGLDSNCIIYEYQPDGKGKKGQIIYDKLSGDMKVEKLAENDTDHYYAEKAMYKVKTFVSKKNLPMEYTQAWY